MQTVLQQKSQNFVNLAQKFSGNFLLKKIMNFSLIFHIIFVFAHFFKNSRHIRLNLANSGTVRVVNLHLFPFSAFSSYFIKRRFFALNFCLFSPASGSKIDLIKQFELFRIIPKIQIYPKARPNAKSRRISASLARIRALLRAFSGFVNQSTPSAVFGSIFEICSPSKAEQRTGAYSHPPLRDQRKKRADNASAPTQLHRSSGSTPIQPTAAPPRLRLSSAQLAHSVLRADQRPSTTVPAKQNRLNLYQFFLSLLTNCLFSNCLFVYCLKHGIRRQIQAIKQTKKAYAESPHKLFSFN